jgi:hypothetical protein
MTGWLFWAGYTLALLGVGGLIENWLGWRRFRRKLDTLIAESYARSAELAELRADVGEVAAYLFANEDSEGEQPWCDHGIDEIVAANPQLADLGDKGWLLARNDSERD